MSEKDIEKRIVRETNKLFLLADMIEMTAVRLQENHVQLNTYKFDIKHKIEQIKKLSGDLVRMVNLVYKDNEDVQISFGETSDILLDKITNELYGEL